MQRKDRLASMLAAEYQPEKRMIGIFGAIILGTLSIFFFVIAPVIGVGLWPSVAVPYGSFVDLASMLAAVLCVAVVNFPSLALIRLTLLIQAGTAVTDLVFLIIMASYAYTSPSLLIQQAFVFAALLVSLQVVLGLMVSFSLLQIHGASQALRS